MEHSGDRPIPNIRESSSSSGTTGEVIPPQQVPTAKSVNQDLSSVRGNLSSLQAPTISLEGFNFRFTTDTPSKVDQPKGFAGKVVSSLRKLKDILVVNDKPVPIEQLDERTVAYLILTNQRNVLRGSNPTLIQPFNAADILRDAGYIALNPNADYESKWPAPYTRALHVLRSLRDNGAIEFLEPDQDHAHRNPGYRVLPEQAPLLMELAKTASQTDKRFDPKSLTPLK